MHVCLFDIDGTLLNTGGAGQAAMNAALASEFQITAPTHGVSYAGRTDRAITVDLFEHHGVPGDEHTWQRFLQFYLQHLPEQLTKHTGQVLPGIVSLLEALSEREDVLLGLLTGNYSDGAWAKLQHYDLHQYFKFGGFGDHHYDRNDVARAALAEIRSFYAGEINLDRVWVIGDTPGDVRCGRAIGAKVVAVGTGFASMEELEAAAPDYLFADFSDPQAILKLLV
jgi:phosphoglycolate phosphatase